MRYNKETLERLVKESTSLSQVIEKLGNKPVGSNFKTLKKYLDEFGIDYSGIYNKSWNKGDNLSDKTCLNRLEDITINGITYKSDSLKKRLINAGIKEYKCERCGRTEWEGAPIPIELHHINGNHFDNRLDNLQILCCNCHALTGNFRGKNRNTQKEAPRQEINHYIKKCLYCGKEFKADRERNRYCSRECYSKAKKTTEPIFQKDELEKLCNECSNISDLAKRLNTSRPTIKKYLDRYNLLEDFKRKFDFRAKEIEQYDISGNLIRVWPSISDAEETLHIFSIEKCCNLKRKSAGGFIWKYKKTYIK